MSLSGSEKKQYQREYMRWQKATSGEPSICTGGRPQQEPEERTPRGD